MPIVLCLNLAALAGFAWWFFQMGDDDDFDDFDEGGSPEVVQPMGFHTPAAA
jgi:hypothetical protein